MLTFSRDKMRKNVKKHMDYREHRLAVINPEYAAKFSVEKQKQLVKQDELYQQKMKERAGLK